MAQSNRPVVGSRPVTGSLVPRKDSHGTEVFHNCSRSYVVRSDLGCYLQASDTLEKGSNIKIHKLHPSCQGGDHYVSSWLEPNIYIIKGSSYRVVKDLSTDEGAQDYELHPWCRGGDHYGRVDWRFFIIFQDQGIIRWVTYLSTAEGENNSNLHPDCRKGLYYYGTAPHLTLIRMDEKWGAQVYLYPDGSEDKPISFFSIHPDVLNFFPGGLALTKGASTGDWECVKTLHNDSDSSITWSDKATCKVGYAKQHMSSIELGAGELTKFITQFQFSFKAEYGGKSVVTEQEDWNEVQEEEESVQVTLEPKKNLYIWQYALA